MRKPLRDRRPLGALAALGPGTGRAFPSRPARSARVAPRPAPGSTSGRFRTGRSAAPARERRPSTLGTAASQLAFRAAPVRSPLGHPSARRRRPTARPTAVARSNETGSRRRCPTVSRKAQGPPSPGGGTGANRRPRPRPRTTSCRAGKPKAFARARAGAGPSSDDPYRGARCPAQPLRTHFGYQPWGRSAVAGLFSFFIYAFMRHWGMEGKPQLPGPLRVFRAPHPSPGISERPSGPP